MRSKPTRPPARPRLPLLASDLLGFVLALGVLTGAAAPARANDCAPESGLSSCIDADNLWLRPGSSPFFSIGSAGTAPAGKASFGFALSYLSRPIGLVVPGPSADGTAVYVLDNMLDATFLWSLGLTDRLEVTLAAPLTVYQDGAGLGGAVGTDDELPRSAIRDPRLGIALAILPRPRVGPQGGLALTARMDFGLPAGDESVFAGAATASATPSLVAELRAGRLLAAAEAGARLRGSSSIARTTVGPQLLGALGASVDVLPDRWLSVGAEAFALYTLAEQPSSPLVPAEWIVSATSAPLLAGDASLSLGGGGAIPFGAEAAVTAPRFRFTLGLRYAPTGRDADGDGVIDRDDACVDAPEDRDGFRDGDGCPDPDNDGDRVPDARDRCRDAPETVDGFEDDDGCPDPDDDHDGIADGEDRCRNAAEDKDNFQDDDGCPDPDNDGDGILDRTDTCPNGAEDKDGFKDEDGCPDPDDDLDQVLDANDACPDAKEDRDAFEDDDGCPDPDNDEDGILDKSDACPATPETIDGKADEDGCPEPDAKPAARWSGDQVIIDGLARFTPASAKMPPALEAQLRMAAQLIRGRLPVETVIVEAYPDRAGDGSARALELAAARADAVKQLLAGAGVPADVITAAAGDPLSTLGGSAGTSPATPPNPLARRPPNAPQIEITVTRARRPGPRTPTATPPPPAQEPRR